MIKVLTVLILAINLAAQAQHSVTGVISDGNRRPVQGVVVTIKGTTQSAVSSEIGRYSIVVPSNETILVYSLDGNIVSEVYVSTQREIDVRINTNVRPARNNNAANVQPDRIDPVYNESTRTTRSTPSNAPSNQIQGEFRVSFDGGFIRQISENNATEAANKGRFTSISFGHNVQHNMNLGVKIVAAGINTRNYDFHYSQFFTIFAATYTYYFGTWAFPFIPYIGGGLGVTNTSSFHSDYRGRNNVGNTTGSSHFLFESRTEIRESKLCGFVTTGVEFGKFRVAAEYNIIPASQDTRRFYDSNGTHLRTDFLKSRNGFLAVTVGFFIGGGKRTANTANDKIQ